MAAAAAEITVSLMAAVLSELDGIFPAKIKIKTALKPFHIIALLPTGVGEGSVKRYSTSRLATVAPRTNRKPGWQQQI